MTKIVVLNIVITKVLVIRRVMIKIAENRMWFHMLKVKINFNIKKMVGKVKVIEALLLLLSVSSVEYWVIML